MIEVIDDAGRRVVLAAPAQRIVSLVPSLTEALFAVGSGAALIGVTRYCTEPADAVQHIERVGGTKNPDCARICSLEPDLVVINAEENRREDFETLEREGVAVFVTFSHRVRDVVGLLERLGVLTGCVAAAQQLGQQVQQALDEINEHPATRRRVFCPIWKNPWMSFNHETYADDMLSLAGGDNVCRTQSARYCTIELSDIAAADPEVIMLPDEPYVFAAKDLPALAPLRNTSAYKSGRIHFIDGKALSWYGPRTAAALRYMRAIVTAESAGQQPETL